MGYQKLAGYLMLAALILTACAPSSDRPEPTIIPTETTLSHPGISPESLQQGQAPYAFLSSAGVEVRLLAFVPDSYDPAVKMPLLVFLHGSSSVGNNLDDLTDITPIDYVEDPADFPFILISPQLPDGLWSDMVEPLEELLDYITVTLAVDADRLYLTGRSLGGLGTWDYALRYPDRFAAIAPVAGGPTDGPISTIPDNLCALKDLPIWVFHGERDPVVSPDVNVEAVAILEACDADVQITVYPAIGHNAWEPTYSNPDFYDWLLEQSK